MRSFKLINNICNPERKCGFKERLSITFGAKEIPISYFNIIMDRIMQNSESLPSIINSFLSLSESDLLIFAYDDSSPLSGEFMNIFFERKELLKKTIFVIYASKEYFVTNMSLIEQKVAELRKICPEEEFNSHLYLVNTDNEGDMHFLLDGIWNFGTEKINVPRTEMNFNLMLKFYGKSVIDIQKDVTLPDIDFWTDSEFVHLTKCCAIGDTYAMMALGDYYVKHENNEFCRLASNYWYCTAFLYGNKEAKHWLAHWIGKKIPMPILPNKIYKTYEIWCHDNEHYYRGVMLKALGFSFFDKKRNYEIFRFHEHGLVEICSWCNDEDPDEDGYGMSEEYDWWFLDELFNELPDVKMLHSYSFHERQLAFTEKFDKQYENAKIALEIKRLRAQQMKNNL